MVKNGRNLWGSNFAVPVHPYKVPISKLGKDFIFKSLTGCAEKMITTTLASAILTSEAVEARTLLQSIGTLLSF